MKFTDNEIREAFHDEKASRHFARDSGCKEAEREAFVKMTALIRWMHDRKAPQMGWISCAKQQPKNGQRVLAIYKGVYGPRVVTYWFDGTNHHFGEPPVSNPASHWCQIPAGCPSTEGQAS